MDWDPTQFFRDEVPPTPFALLILNQPINDKAYDVLRKHALITVCADGGANRFYDMMQSRSRESLDHPDIIIGDLDSVRPSVRTHYESHSIPVIYHYDDYSTDFQKSLDYIRAHTSEILSTFQPPSPSPQTQTPSSPLPQQPLSILILGGLGGRVDQAFSQIHHLYTQTQHQRHLQSSPDTTTATAAGNLYLISEESITFILHPGKNTIHTPCTNRPGVDLSAESYLLEENVGIVPLSGMTRISTSGFQWDVEQWETEIGGQISTSNHVRGDVVSVQAPGPVLLTLELAGRFKRGR
ncbi:thiamine pyrophosphokinase [Aspergillus ellipticus CBS 707.79]|uniref:Thiamine pyrophosphokinase n=1 Tax=Aspergillus ellipticus CBS 707.79 TaxID=1448320 RepID=A0A319CTX5_9EURO|nr:thiamine pyrophosphokinase [Aspergillus ellipticus CBS 707.79]